MVWSFIGVYITNRTLHGYEISLLVLKIYLTSARFNTRREILYLCATM